MCSLHKHVQALVYAYLDRKIGTFKLYPDFVSYIGLAYNGFVARPSDWP